MKNDNFVSAQQRKAKTYFGYVLLIYRDNINNNMNAHTELRITNNVMRTHNCAP